MKVDSGPWLLVKILSMYFKITVSNLAQKYSEAWLSIASGIHKTLAITDLRSKVYFAISKH